MSQCGFDGAEMVRTPIRLLSATLLAATLLTAPAVAQTQPSAQAIQGPVQSVLSPAKAPEPTFDEERRTEDPSA